MHEKKHKGKKILSVLEHKRKTQLGKKIIIIISLNLEIPQLVIDLYSQVISY